MIKREEYLKEIRPLIEKDIIKVIMGIKQSGKSTLLKQIKTELTDNGISEENILEMNFDSMQFPNIKDKNDLNNHVSKFIKNPKEKYYLLFDEIANVDGWERSLSGFIVDFNVDIYITGSNRKLLSGKLATHLTGRYMKFNIYPLSFKEVIEINKQNDVGTDLNTLFKDYITWGGMPFIHSAIKQENNQKKTYLHDVYNSIIHEDTLKQVNIDKIYLMDKLTQFIVQNVGNHFSTETLSQYLKNEIQKYYKHEAICNHIKYFENAYLINITSKINIQNKSLLKRIEKIYLTDTGFRQAIYGYNKEDLQQILENIVYMELIRRDYEITVGSIDKNEITFIARKNGLKRYFIVLTESNQKGTYKDEFDALLKIPDNYPKYLLTMDDNEYNYEGIEKKSIINFLIGDWWD